MRLWRFPAQGRCSGISGGSDAGARPGANFHLPRSETKARPNALRRANRLGYRRGVLSEKRKLHWRRRPPSTRRTPFASRTNWSRFPPVRNIVPPWLAVSCDAKSRHLSRVNCQKSFSFRWSRGSDLRLLRLTMDGLPDRHIWGATPCIKDRPRPKARPDEVRSSCRQN